MTPYHPSTVVSLEELGTPPGTWMRNPPKLYAVVLKLPKDRRTAQGLRIPDGEEYVRLTLELDVEGLAVLLGRKAARSAGKGSKLQDGLVKVKVTGRDPVTAAAAAGGAS